MIGITIENIGDHSPAQVFDAAKFVDSMTAKPKPGGRSGRRP